MYLNSFHTPVGFAAVLLWVDGSAEVNVIDGKSSPGLAGSCEMPAKPRSAPPWWPIAADSGVGVGGLSQEEAPGAWALCI